MHNIWTKRFQHYVNEIQKYTQYIFTGHIGVVIVFALGALGYQYNQWLNVVEPSFPAEWLVAIFLGVLIAFSLPVTLLKEPDQVYLLPLETKMKIYFSKVLRWTFLSQILVPIILYIVAIPLLREVTDLSIQMIWLGVLFIIVLKGLNVWIEFSYRFANRGQMIWLDRLVRIALNILVIEGFLHEGIAMGALYSFLLVAYYLMVRKKVYVHPIPYEHFVKIEQNRMMRFYRFANLFTDVPHLRGAIKRRAWLDVVYKWIPKKQGYAQRYLITRTFIRTNDLFFLWVRLTLISAIFAAFINIPVVAWILAGALVFATVLQLKQALNDKGIFRMDMAYPGKPNEREVAVNQLLTKLVVLQAIIVTLSSVMTKLFYVNFIVIIAIGLLTIRTTKNQ